LVHFFEPKTHLFFNQSKKNKTISTSQSTLNRWSHEGKKKKKPLQINNQISKTNKRKINQNNHLVKKIKILPKHTKIRAKLPNHTNRPSLFLGSLFLRDKCNGGREGDAAYG
jgi:hypothetical protein